MNEKEIMSSGREERVFPDKKSIEYREKIQKQFIAFQNKKMKRR